LIVAVPVTAIAPVTSALTIAVRGRQKTHVLDAGVDALLEKFVEAGTFGLDLVNVGDFGPEGDAELMAAVLGQADLLAIVAF
jgi:hypothetical protein